MARPRTLGAVIAGLVVANLALLGLGAGRGGEAVCQAEVCVGLVFDVGGLGDKSFNDSAYRGLVRAEKELGVSTRYIEPGDGSDRESALRQLASQGYPLIIAVGFIFSDDVRKLSREFPDTHFVCIDFSARQGEQVPANLSGMRFREHEGSFLVGAVAGLTTTSKVVGFVGGMDIPLIHKFEAGYRAGVRHVCPGCQVLAAYAGTEPRAFSDPVLGKEIALAQYGRGADVIYHASGKTGSGVFTAAREVGRWAIGTDSDQFHEMPCCVLTSMIKGVDVAVFEAIRDLVSGEFHGGVRELGLREGGVGYVWDDNNRDRIPPAVAAQVEALARDIIDGRIEVPSR
jgi:basic membrane protein A and related proteins